MKDGREGMWRGREVPSQTPAPPAEGPRSPKSSCDENSEGKAVWVQVPELGTRGERATGVLGSAACQLTPKLQ